MTAKSLSVALLCCLPPPKPVMLHLAGELDAAQLVAEVEVLEVALAAPGGRAGAVRGRIDVRVTSDPTRVFVGHQLLGRELSLEPPRFGPASSTADLADRIGDVLFVVVGEGDEVRIFGDALEGAGGQWGYRLWSYCDFNAAIVYHGDDRLKVAPARPLEQRVREFHGPVCVRAGGVVERLAGRRAALLGRAAARLLESSHVLSERELARLVFELGDTAAAAAAERRLVADGADRIRELREAAERNHDPAVAARLTRVLEAHADAARAHDLAAAYRRAGRDAEAALLVEFAPRCADDRLRRLAFARLRAWADQHELDTDGETELLAAVRRALGLGG